MNLDDNVQKILFAVLRKWKLIVLFAIIGALIGYFYTANFTTLTYTSKVEFLAYATDGNDDIASSNSNGESIRYSNTSKMNYAMHMLDTYIEIMQTNKFAETLVEDLNATYIEIMKTNKFAEQLVDDMNKTYNANYDVGTVLGTMTIEKVESTAMFKITVTTDEADRSYKIAKQLETSVPKMMKNTNNGLVRSSVEDRAARATSAGSLNYPRKMIVSTLAGIIIAAAYVILRTLLDVRIKSGEELTEKYSIPVLGQIPSFEDKLYRPSQDTKGVKEYVKK